mmetsp:Transcript_49757/g.116311  ORF Transcript_49757/g.116311 Transcript_49757/m.116311 type:complete len:80 (+) Transcript_49757:252-491(+)|eukprot:6022088-Amphidinium_carterae.1
MHLSTLELCIPRMVLVRLGFCTTTMDVHGDQDTASLRSSLAAYKSWSKLFGWELRESSPPSSSGFCIPLRLPPGQEAQP